MAICTKKFGVNVALPGKVVLEGYSEIGGIDAESASWSLSQSYEEVEVIGFNDPIVAYSEGTITIEIKGADLTDELTEDTYSSCVASPKDYSLDIQDCSGNSIGTLDITSGYMQGRGSSASAEGTVSPTVKIIQFI
jgi:hypothetical protein